ncbi:hypothetical protein V8D89_002541 [Ganoderma adspersum]
MAPVASLDHETLVSVSPKIVTTDVDSAATATEDPAPGDSDSSSSPPAFSFKQATDSLKLRPRDFVWGAKLIRNALPRPTIPPCLDPLDVDIDDPKKLPLCWYGVPFYPDIVFAYAERIRLGVYLEEKNLHLKAGDLDVYNTWPKLVKWFEEQSGFTMQLHQVWRERKPLFTFFSNHEMASVTTENWELIDAMLDEMDYPRECELMWYLDIRLDDGRARFEY